MGPNIIFSYHPPKVKRRDVGAGRGVGKKLKTHLNIFARFPKFIFYRENLSMRFTQFFRNFFWTEKLNPQSFSLFGCMITHSRPNTELKFCQV